MSVTFWILPREVLICITEYIVPVDLIRLSHVNKYLYSIVSPEITKVKVGSIVQFKEFAGWGKWRLKKGKVTSIAGDEVVVNRDTKKLLKHVQIILKPD